PPNLSDSQSSEANDEISILDLLIVLAKHKILILGLPFVVAVIAAGYSLTLPNIYTATAKILPPQQSQSAASAMLTQLGGLAGLAGGAVGLKTPNDLYIAMLKSRTVADKMIQRFELMKIWEIDIKHPSDAYKELADVTKITAEKDGTITIAVDDKDNKTAADLANAYVDELVKFTNVLAVTEASQRRLFFERQFALAKDNLSKAEEAARRALQTGGLVKVDDQGRAMVEVTARLRGQITVKEVQIGVMQTFAADRNPQLELARQELASLKRELSKIEGGGDTKSETISPSGKGSDSLRLLRGVKYNEVLYELLARQYELAKIDEAKGSSVVQVMDRAIVPDRKSKPRRILIVLLSAFAALVFSILWVFVREGIARAKSDPQQASRLLDLKRFLAWK
ncbi:MAG: lipopolysaccharide biosynthesis protein, partial [Betaproteobacteria bacterium]|nr:lipopolysaccharide biosynthesis protein [Betaproteobacteria bacterium]